jgi:hypothetical protein
MAQRNERAEILAEVGGVLRDHGVTSDLATSLSAEDAVHVRSVALRIIQGDIDREELLALSEGLANEVTITVQRLMALKNTPPIRDLEERNPYYSVFQPKVIRDGPESVGE